MSTNKIFDIFDPHTDPEGIISKYTAFESFRLVRDNHLQDMKGSLQDRLKVLMWYLVDYVSHRNADYQLPLSREQIKFLNSPFPVAGCSPAVTVALWNFVQRELPSHTRLDQPHILREALYWWCVEKAPSIKLDKVLVTEAQINFLRTDEQWIREEYPFNAFMIMYFNRHVEVHELDANKSKDRLAFLYFLIIRSYTEPHLLRLISKDLIRSALRNDKNGVKALDKVISKFLFDNQENIAEAEKIRSYGETIYECLTGDRAYDYKLYQNSNCGDCFKIKYTFSSNIEEGVCLIGPIQQTSGLGQATRISYEILKYAEDIKPTVLPFAVDNPAPVGFASTMDLYEFKERREINLIHLNAESIPLAFAFEQQEILKDSYNIGYFFWELNEIPKCHALALELLDEIWVSSEYNRETYIKFTNKPVINVGMSVEKLPDVKNINLNIYGIEEGNVVFLTTFDSFSFIERKNPLAVISAFLKAFPNGNENVNLIIKTQNKTRVGDPYQIELWKKIDRLISNDSRILVVNETMKYRELLELKASCDCYVSLHRSEGWGFGMIEAMQLGKPVIATSYGGNMDFCNSDTAYLIDYNLISVRPEEYIFVERGSVWADPLIDQAAHAMLSVFSNIEMAQAKGANAAEFVRNKFGKEAIAKRYSKRITEIRELIHHKKGLS